MSNIYDIFNSRKAGIESLVEGFNFEDDSVEAYESLDAAVEALEAITLESNNACIELQAAHYLEDLVIESMMFDEFDEEKITATIEASIKEKASGLAAKVKEQWEKIKAWFVATAKAIANHFLSGEKLVEKYRSEIPGAMEKCKKQVKMPLYNEPKQAINNCFLLIQRIEKMAYSMDNKDQLLKSVGANDKKGLQEKVKNIFVKKLGEKVSVDSIDPDWAMMYAGGKKEFLDAIEKDRKVVDEGFSAMLGIIEKDNGKGSKQYVVFNFAQSLANAVLGMEVQCIKAGCSAYAKVIRAALGPQKAEKPEKPEKGKKEEKVEESFSLDDIEFLDEE